MCRLIPQVGLLIIVSLALGILAGGSASAQEKSLCPGINKSYENPSVKEYVGRFEVESREVFAHRKEIVAACHLKPGMVIGDIGAGTGLFTRLFSPEAGSAGQIYAVDITPKFLEHIKKTCEEAGLRNVKTVLCTPDSVQLPPRSIDLAFLCDTYHHFEFPQKTMASIHRAIRPGGQLVVVEFCRIQGKTPEWLMKHVRAGQEVFAHEIESAGFQQVDECKFLKENYFLRFKKVDASR